MTYSVNNVNSNISQRSYDINKSQPIVKTYEEKPKPHCCIIPPHMSKKIAENHPDAHTKDLAKKRLAKHDQIRSDRKKNFLGTVNPKANVTVYDARHKENDTDLPGKKVRKIDDSNPDIEVKEAAKWATATYNFWKDKRGRNSIDGKGMEIRSSVHFGINYDNAFWNGKQMVYGDGDPRGSNQVFTRFTIASDITGHELGHGVVQYAMGTGGGLDVDGQPGSLNEHFADVSGEQVRMSIENTKSADSDWLIGKGVLVGNYALRNMLKPGTAYKNHPILGDDPQPDHMANFVVSSYDDDGDHGGVHINNGIPNRAFAEAAVALGGYAWEKVGKIWFDSYPNIKPNAQFIDAANATVATAQKEFGFDSVEYRAVAAGWRTVGVLK